MKALIIRRRVSGSAIVELVVGLPAIMIVVCLALHILMVLMQARILDLAARDAARAASTAVSKEEALGLARAAVAVHAIYGVVPTITDKDIVYDDNNGVAAPSNGPGPLVTVTVSSKLCLPFGAVPILGCTEGQKAMRSYTFPLLQLAQNQDGRHA